MTDPGAAEATWEAAEETLDTWVVQLADGGGEDSTGGVVSVTGGVDSVTGGAGSAATTAVGAEVADVGPPALVATTAMRSVCPTSLLVSRWLAVVAPLMLEQLLAEVVQSCHW